MMMLFSLFLLSAFLLWFVRRVWNDEVAALNREGNLLLVKAVRHIEGETLDRFLYQQIHLPPDDTVQFHKRLPLLLQPDSLKMTAILNEDKTVVRRVVSSSDGVVSDDINSDIKIIRKGDQTTGALSVMLSFRKENRADSLLSSAMDTGLVAKRLTTVFSEVMAQAVLPVMYTIQRSHFDSLPGDQSAISYFDLASKDRYDIVLSGYSGYILGRIWPQILFSGLLFSMISLAFFLIRQNLKRQQQLTEIKNDFIRNITHELKTPVATVRVAIEALQHFGAMEHPERAREYLAISGAELNRLSLLIDKVLWVSLFEEGETTINKDAFDFQVLVEEIIASMQLQFDKHQAKVDFLVLEGVFIVNGDRLHLASVVYNLLDNALKYSPASPEVSVEMRRLEEKFILRITDKGQGIPAVYLDKIFEKFFRVPNGDVHNIKGHGLGLSYAAGVVRQHAGDIRVESRVGEGTSFVIELPV
jgi:signal transduction histidine kinase